MKPATIMTIVCCVLLVPTSGVIYAAWQSSQYRAERIESQWAQLEAERRELARQCNLMFPRGEVNRRKCIEGTL